MPTCPRSRLLGRLSAFTAALLFVPLLTLTGAPAASADEATSDCVDPSAAGEREAQVLAVTCGVEVEVLDARTPYTQVLASPDGTMSMGSSIVPRWVPEADGSWSDVDTVLVVDADGRLAPAAALADVSFSPGGDGPLVRLKSADGRELTLSWPTSLPTGQVTGDAVLYPEVYPGVDLRVRATPTGFSHTLVVKSAEAATNPALERIPYVIGGDVRVAEMPHGGLSVVAGDRLLATADPAVMWDSTRLTLLDGSKALGAEPSDAETTGDGAQVAQVEIEVTEETMELIPDADLLTGTDTVYPVYIDPEFSTDETKWAYANTSNRDWGADPSSAQARVGRDPGNGWVYRSLFQFPTTAHDVNLDDKQILSVHFVITLYHSWSCDPTRVYLYRSRTPTSPRTTWSGADLDKYLTSKEAAANKGVCYSPEDPNLDFSSSAFRSDVQNAADEHWNHYTVALSARSSGGSGESIQERWKKFEQSTALFKVTYNSYPDAPSELRVGTVGCRSDEILVAGGDQKLSGVFGDDDGTQQTLTGSIQWGPAGGTVADGTTSDAAGDTRASFQVNGLPNGHYQFRMRSDDGHAASPWSSWCYFEVDATSPTPPVVGSQAYPVCDETGSCPVTAFPGISADFTFAASTDAVGYVYGWSSTPTTPVGADTPGEPVTVTLTPPTYGLNVLFVRSVDLAGNQSADASYSFMVARSTPAIAGWSLENRPDTPGDALSNTVPGGQSLTAGPTLTWKDDVRLVGASTAAFDDVAWADTALPVVDTSASFGVSAWVKLDSDAAYSTAVSQQGNAMSVFRLQYRVDAGAWCMTIRETDVDGGPLRKACQDVAPALGVWTHLTGVFDAAENELRLFVNGELVAEEPLGMSLWNATGAFSVGRASCSAGPCDTFEGQIADVRVFDRVVGVDDVLQGASDLKPLMSTNPVGRWNFDLDCCGTAVNQVQGWGNDLAIQAPAALQSLDDGYALQTVNSVGYAETGGPAIRTDQSFTVAAWIQIDDLQDYSTAVSQDGVNISAFRLQNRRFTVDGVATSKWCMTLRMTDADGGDLTMACSAEASTLSLTHLIGVYDAVKGEIRLYVNGGTIGADGSAQPTAVVAMPGSMWNATGKVGVGRGKDPGNVSTSNPAGNCDMFDGFVDDAAIFQGAMNDEQASAFYNSVRGA